MWHRSGAAGDRAGSPEEARLVHECEAFLSGRLAEELEDRQQPVPAWAWMNMLAHGTPRQLRSMAYEGLGGAFTTVDAWERGLCFLAREVLAMAEERGCTVEELQRRALVPLELEMTRDVGWVETGPGLLVMRVVAALGHYRGRATR